MKVLVTPQFQEQARSERIDLTALLKEATSILEPLRPDQVNSVPSIRQLQDTSEQIYVLRQRGLRAFLTFRGNDALLIGVKRHHPQLDVSKGRVINFTAEGVLFSGTIVKVEETAGPWASVVVQTNTAIPDGAQLLIPELPETGGCGLAHPVRQNEHALVALSVGYSYIDLSTISR
ncbi:MAG: hypothetical protein ACREIF_02170 [Chthoniobacterales bacterium]